MRTLRSAWRRTPWNGCSWSSACVAVSSGKTLLPSGRGSCLRHCTMSDPSSHGCEPVVGTWLEPRGTVFARVAVSVRASVTPARPCTPLVVSAAGGVAQTQRHPDRKSSVFCCSCIVPVTRPWRARGTCLQRVAFTANHVDRWDALMQVLQPRQQEAEPLGQHAAHEPKQHGREQ